jgi:AcrR family transcriptional regulator
VKRAPPLSFMPRTLKLHLQPERQILMTDRKRGTASSELGRRRKTLQKKDSAAYAARREEIIAAAGETFSKEGYDGTSLSEIARRSGTDRASMYYYISSKEELFQEVCSGALEANLIAADEIAGRDISAQEKLELIIEHHMVSHERFPQWTVVIQEMRRITDADTTWSRNEVAKMRRYESIVLTVLEEGVADGTIRADVPPRLAMNAIFGMLNWTHRWFRPNRKYSAKDVATAFAAISIDGLAARSQSVDDQALDGDDLPPADRNGNNSGGRK